MGGKLSIASWFGKLATSIVICVYLPWKWWVSLKLSSIRFTIIFCIYIYIVLRYIQRYIILLFNVQLQKNYYNQGECWWCLRDLRGFRGWWLKRYFWVWRNIWCNCLEDIIEIHTWRQLCKKPPKVLTPCLKSCPLIEKNLTILSKTRTVDYCVYHEQSMLIIPRCCP